MKYIQGIASNVKTHESNTMIASKERSESYTQHICTFDIDSKGMSYKSGRPANISDGDKLSIAYKNSFFSGRKVKAIWNGSNMTCSGCAYLPLFIVFVLIVSIIVPVIFLDLFGFLEFFKTPIRFYSKEIPLLMALPWFGMFVAVLSLISGVKMLSMVRKLHFHGSASLILLLAIS